MDTIFSLPDAALDTAACNAFGITGPTDIQQEAIPRILDGRNVILGSPTGTGKTLAYLLPLLCRVDPTLKANQLLIVSPTQELAVQIAHVLRALNDQLAQPYPTVLASGGANIRYQLEALKAKPAVLVGTPGRLLELFNMHRINGQTIRAVVFDEIDAICEHDQGQAYTAIKKALLRDCQTLAASASMDASTKALLQQSLPEADWLGQGSAALNPNIDHLVLYCEARKKFDHLRQALAAFDGQLLIFLNGEDDIRRLQDRLAYHHIEADTLYADMKKADRAETLRRFRAGLSTVLIASDLGARGLDVPGIDLVINMDFPRDPQTYVHRAGRTARGRASGYALSFAAPQDSAAIRIYSRDLGIDFHEVHFAQGALVAGPAPQKDRKDQESPAAAAKSRPDKHTSRKGMPKRLKEAHDQDRQQASPSSAAKAGSKKAPSSQRSKTVQGKQERSKKHGGYKERTHDRRQEGPSSHYKERRQDDRSGGKEASYKANSGRHKSSSYDRSSRADGRSGRRGKGDKAADPDRFSHWHPGMAQDGSYSKHRHGKAGGKPASGKRKGSDQ